MNNYTSKEELVDQFNVLKREYNASPYPSLTQRKQVLRALKKSLIAHEQEFYQALNEDYGHRSEFDTLVADLLPSVMSINYTLKHLRKWLKPSKRHAGLMLMPSTVEVQFQPVGVVGIIVPWNFPLFLSMSPATQALAAGNRVMIKLSEFTPKTNQVLRKATQCIKDHMTIAEGVRETGEAFSALPFDHLVFTGSTTVGRSVARAAADNLTPITLELGGKSPAIFARDANWKTAIDAVILGKVLNSGQMCVSPDYVLVPRGEEEAFVSLFKERYKACIIDANSTSSQTHIINQRQSERLKSLLADATDKGAEVHLIGEGQSDSGEEFQSPRLLTSLDDAMDIMQQEIFGPVMPVLPYDSIDECIQRINARPRPLALYVMSTNKHTIKKVLQETHSGGVCVNDTTMHVAAEDAPFGGIGDSGIGHYHGEEGFRRLSKAKTVLRSKSWLPKNKLFLRYRDLAFVALRKLLLR